MYVYMDRYIKSRRVFSISGPEWNERHQTHMRELFTRNPSKKGKKKPPEEEEKNSITTLLGYSQNAGGRGGQGT